MKAIRLSWTDFNKEVHSTGLLTGNKLLIDLQNIKGRFDMDVWPSDTEYLDPEITGQLAPPRAQITPDTLSITTKQAWVTFINSLFQDIVDGTQPLEPLKPPTVINPTTGSVIDQPTE